MLTHTHICIPQYLVEVLRQVGRTGGVGNTSWMTVPAGSYWVRQVMVKETRIEWSRLANVNNHRAGKRLAIARKRAQFTVDETPVMGNVFETVVLLGK